MSIDREDSLTESSPLFQAYHQELQQIFRDDDSAIIKAAIFKYRNWDSIVEALLNEETKRELIEEISRGEEEETHNVLISSQTSQENKPTFSFSLKATSYDGRCRLYLPPSLISVDMDLNLFGSFDSDDNLQNLKEPLYVQPTPQIRGQQQNVQYSRLPRRSNSNVY